MLPSPTGVEPWLGSKTLYYGFPARLQTSGRAGKLFCIDICSPPPLQGASGGRGEWGGAAPGVGGWPWPRPSFLSPHQSLQLPGRPFNFRENTVRGSSFGGKSLKFLRGSVVPRVGAGGESRPLFCLHPCPVQSRCPPASLPESEEGRWCPLVRRRPHFLWNLDCSAGPPAFQEGGNRWCKGGRLG